MARRGTGQEPMGFVQLREREGLVPNVIFHNGLVDRGNGQVDRKEYRTGCNTYLSPDNSYMVTIMDGGHTLVTLYKPDGSSRDVSVVPPNLKKQICRGYRLFVCMSVKRGDGL